MNEIIISIAVIGVACFLTGYVRGIVKLLLILLCVAIVVYLIWKLTGHAILSGTERVKSEPVKLVSTHTVSNTVSAVLGDIWYNIKLKLGWDWLWQ